MMHPAHIHTAYSLLELRHRSRSYPITLPLHHVHPTSVRLKL